MEILEGKEPIVLMAIWKSVEGGAEATLVARILDSERGVIPIGAWAAPGKKDCVRSGISHKN